MINKPSGTKYYFLAAMAGAVIALLFAIPSVRPPWAFGGALLLALVLVGLVKFPSAMLVPVIFIPQWKTLPFLEGVQRTIDLTLVALIILCLVLAFQLMADLVRHQSILQLFSGQRAGVVAFFVFSGVVAASYLYTPAKDWGWTQMIRLWGIGGLLVLSPLVLIKREKDFRQFAVAFLFFSLVLATQQIAIPEYGAEGKLGSIVRTDIGAAWLIGMAILLLLYYELFESRSVLWAARVLGLPLLAAGLVAATARGPVVSLLLVLLAVPWVSPAYRLSASRMLKWLAILTLILAGSWLAFTSLKWTETRYKKKTSELVAIWRGETAVGSAGERLQFYKAALREIPERPILGLGTGGWGVFYTGRDIREYPHNLFLLVAVEEGIIGLLALFGFLTVVGLTLQQIHKRTGGRFVVLFAEVTFCLVCSMFSGDLDTNRMLWFWCGVTFAFSRMVKLAVGNGWQIRGDNITPLSRHAVLLGRNLPGLSRRVISGTCSHWRLVTRDPW